MREAVAATQTMMSLEEYLTGDFEPDADFVDGFLEERSAGQFDHSSWQEALQAWFRLHYPEWQLRARPELRNRISQTRYRVPDVAVMDMRLPVEQIVNAPPVAVFEILSPEDRLPRVLVKLADFERMGVGNIFLVDPAGPVASLYRNGQLETAASRVELAGSLGFVDWEMIQQMIY